MARINAVSFHETPNIEAICRIVRAAGFDSLELSRPPFYQKLITPSLRQRFATWAAAQGLSLYGFDCWVDVDPYTRFEETLAELRACVALFRPIAAWCQQHRLRLVFEPHPDTLSMDDRWAVDFIDAVGEGLPSGSVGLLYDCCHYGVGQPAGYVEAVTHLGRRIQHVHFSDGDKQTYALHLPLGDGALDLDAIVSALCAVGFSGTLTNDLFNYPLLEDGARRNVEGIRTVEQKLGLAAPPGR